jgi:hypothetical protein
MLSRVIALLAVLALALLPIAGGTAMPAKSAKSTMPVLGMVDCCEHTLEVCPDLDGTACKDMLACAAACSAAPPAVVLETGAHHGSTKLTNAWPARSGALASTSSAPPSPPPKILTLG